MREVKGFVQSGKATIEIPFENKSSDKLTIRNFDISNTKLRNVAGGNLKLISYFNKLKPGELKVCEVSFDVDRTLEPGDYSGIISFEKDFRTAFVIYVPEELALQCIPEQLILQGEPSEEITKELLIFNKGNVSLDFSTEYTVIVSETGELNRALGASVLGSSKIGFNKMLDGFVNKLSDSMVRPMNVKFQGNKELLPGQSIKYNLKFMLPPNIKANRNYHGVINLFNTSVSFIINCINKSNKRIKNGIQKRKPRRK